MGEDSGKTRPWYGRVWFWLPALVLVLLGVSLALLPSGVRWYLGGWLKAQGVEGVRIGDVDVNPFTGFLSVETVTLEGDERASTAGRLEINLTWHELPGRRVMLSRISLKDAEVSVRRTEGQGWVVAAIALGAREAVESAQAAEAVTGWGFGFGGAELSNVKVYYSDPLIRRELRIERASLDAFSTWDPDQRTELSADLVVDGTPVRLRGQGTPFSMRPGGFLEVEHAGLDLAPYEPLAALAGVNQLAGRLTGDYRITLKALGEEGVEASLDGRLAADGLVLDTPALRAEASALSWEGPASIDTLGQRPTYALDGVITGEALDALVKAESGAEGTEESAGPRDGSDESAGDGGDSSEGEANVAEARDGPASEGERGSEADAGASREDLQQAPAGEEEAGSGQGAAGPAAAAVAAAPATGLPPRGLARAGAGQLEWRFDGQVALEGPRIEIRGAGTVTARDLAIFLASPGHPGEPDAPGALHGSLAELEAEGEGIDINLDEGLLDLDWRGGARVGKGSLQVGGIVAGMDAGDWQGRVAAVTDPGSRQITLDGRLAVTGATGGAADMAARAEVGRVAWQGRAVASRGEGWGVSAEGEASLDEIAVDRRDGGSRLARIASVKAGLSTGGEESETLLQGLTATEVRLLARDGEGADWLLAAPEIVLDESRLGVGRVALGSVRLQDARAWYEIGADGAPEYRRIMEGVFPARPEPESAAAVEFALAGLETAGEGGLRYVDRSVRPAVDIEISPLSVRLGRLDTSQPDAWTELALEAALGKYTEVAFEGRAKPLAERLSATGQGKVSALSMPVLSPYSRQMLGYGIRRGTLEGSLDLSIEEGYMDSTAELVVRQLEMRRVRPEEAQDVEQQIGTSLETALALLEDDNQTIRLELPLEGNLGQLQVSAQDAVEQVLQKALAAGIKTAAVAYFAPLWPALAVSKILDLASALSFQPVAFPPGGSSLGQAQRDYLDEMARLLADRPKVSVAVCGVAVGSDARTLREADAAAQAAAAGASEEAGDDDGAEPGQGGAAAATEQAPALEARLSELARERQEAVLDHLVGRGISKSRLAACDPEVRAGDSGQPRVELGV